MINRLINRIALAICDWCERTGRVFHIKGGPNGKTVYLVRYMPIQSKYFCLYIHRFMRSDADDPHDHPWNFFTYVISGGYDEVCYAKVPQQACNKNGQYFAALWTKGMKRRERGTIAYRRATDVHQVVVDRNYEMEEIKQAPFTLCLIGPRIREWGFWPLEELGSVWIDWREYLNITPGDSRTKGSE